MVVEDASVPVTVIACLSDAVYEFILPVEVSINPNRVRVEPLKLFKLPVEVSINPNRVKVEPLNVLSEPDAISNLSILASKFVFISCTYSLTAY